MIERVVPPELLLLRVAGFPEGRGFPGGFCDGRGALRREQVARDR